MSSGRDRLPDALLNDLIKKLAETGNRKAGEFRIPRSVVWLMIEKLEPGEDETIYDPG